MYPCLLALGIIQDPVTAEANVDGTERRGDVR